MAIDTRNRRAACLNYDQGWGRVYPDPDGSIAAMADRVHAAGKYPGIGAGAPVAPTIIAQARSVFQMVSARVFGRVN